MRILWGKWQSDHYNSSISALSFKGCLLPVFPTQPRPHNNRTPPPNTHCMTHIWGICGFAIVTKGVWKFYAMVSVMIRRHSIGISYGNVTFPLERNFQRSSVSTLAITLFLQELSSRNLTHDSGGLLDNRVKNVILIAYMFVSYIQTSLISKLMTWNFLVTVLREISSCSTNTCLDVVIISGLLPI